MRMFSLEREQQLPVDIETVFGFFSDAANLELLTPRWLRFKVLTPLPVELQEGTRIEYKLRLRGVPVRWQSEIMAWQPSLRFVDEQRKGPYRRWIHEHRFEAVDGGTLVRDEVSYAVPGGSLVNRLLVRPDLDRVFAYREDRLAQWAQLNTLRVVD